MKTSNNWSKIHELKGGYYGVKIMLFLYSIGGRHLFKLCLYPVIFCFYIFAKEPKANSKYFLKQVQIKRKELNLEKLHLNSYQHFLSFGDMVIDKFNSWKGDLKSDDVACFLDDSKENVNRFTNQKGKIFLCSHLGNFEALRAFSGQLGDSYPKVNVLNFTKNAVNVNNLLKAINPNSQLNIISIDTIGPETAILLQDKILSGEVVAIMGDRTPMHVGRDSKYRVQKASFLNHQVDFPQGVFILCAILQCPVQMLMCLKNSDTNKYDIVCKDLADVIKLDRKDREGSIQKYIDLYASTLEYYAIRYPYQWFNFYNFFENKNK